MWRGKLLKKEEMDNGERNTSVVVFSHFSAVASSLINTSQRVKVIGVKVNIDLRQLELLRAFQVCIALIVELQLAHRWQQ